MCNVALLGAVLGGGINYANMLLWKGDQVWKYVALLGGTLGGVIQYGLRTNIASEPSSSDNLSYQCKRWRHARTATRATGVARNMAARYSIGRTLSGKSGMGRKRRRTVGAV